MTKTNTPVAGAPVPVANSLIGTVFAGRFYVEQLLGAGGMGEVYLVRHEVLRRHFALKLIRPKLMEDEAVLARFRREARIMSRLEYPHIMSIFDFGMAEGTRAYLVMEYVNGPSLARVIRDERRIGLGRALAIWDQIVEAMIVAHQNHIVHRDLKPDNVILTSQRGKKDFVKILDFGLAKIIGNNSSAGLSHQGHALGSPHYMSPEQCLGKNDIDHRADIYSFGIMAYEMISGLLPFDGRLMDVITAQIHTPPRPPSQLPGITDLPLEVDDLILKCLAKSANDRYADCMSLLSDIRTLQQLIVEDDASESTAPGVVGKTRFIVDSDDSITIDPWQEDTLAQKAGHVPRSTSPFLGQLAGLRDLAISIRDRGWGSPEISDLLAALILAQDDLVTAENELTLMSDHASLLEGSAWKREARLRAAIGQIDHELIEEASIWIHGRSRDVPLARKQLEERATQVAQRIQQLTTSTDKQVADIRKQQGELLLSVASLRQQVAQCETALKEKLQLALKQIKAPFDDELLKMIKQLETLLN